MRLGQGASAETTLLGPMSRAGPPSPHSRSVLLTRPVRAATMWETRLCHRPLSVKSRKITTQHTHTRPRPVPPSLLSPTLSSHTTTNNSRLSTLKRDRTCAFRLE